MKYNLQHWNCWASCVCLLDNNLILKLYFSRMLFVWENKFLKNIFSYFTLMENDKKLLILKKGFTLLKMKNYFLEIHDFFGTINILWKIFYHIKNQKILRNLNNIFREGKKYKKLILQILTYQFWNFVPYIK